MPSSTAARSSASGSQVDDLGGATGAERCRGDARSLGGWQGRPGRGWGARRGGGWGVGGVVGCCRRRGHAGDDGGGDSGGNTAAATAETHRRAVLSKLAWRAAPAVKTTARTTRVRRSRVMLMARPGCQRVLGRMSRVRRGRRRVATLPRPVSGFCPSRLVLLRVCWGGV